MRLLCIAIVLALFECNYGQELSSNGNTLENKAAATNPCEVGECVPYYLCVNGTIITSGDGVLDARLGADDDPQPERHPCTDFFETCCSLKQDTIIEPVFNPGPIDDPGFKISPKPVSVPYPSPNAIPNPTPEVLNQQHNPTPDVFNQQHNPTPEVLNQQHNPTPDVFNQQHNPTPEVLNQQHNPTPVINSKPDKCGVRNKNGAVFNLIERDNEAQFAEFPWVVAIVQKLHDKNGATTDEFICGGSLIHPGVVMTAAHCLVDYTDLLGVSVRAGEWDTQTLNEPYPHQDRSIVDVVMNEHYKRGSHFNDITLLFLDKPFDLAENVNTACLPPQDFVFDHQRCFANGWGKDKFGKDGLYQVILKRIELPVVPHGECESKLRGTRLGPHFKLDPSFICAGGESGKDTCTGDGGAPLNCEISQNEHGQYYAAGEVAWGIGCFDPVPGVYVNVAKFRHWIDTIFEQRNLEQKYYIAQ